MFAKESLSWASVSLRADSAYSEGSQIRDIDRRDIRVPYRWTNRNRYISARITTIVLQEKEMCIRDRFWLRHNSNPSIISFFHSTLLNLFFFIISTVFAIGMLVYISFISNDINFCLLYTSRCV